MRLLIILVTAFALLLPSGALAKPTSLLEKDFAAIEGLIVMPINDEFIVDLDARNNLHIGDVLTLVNPGKKIFHPVTKEVMGSIQEPVGFLLVTRVLSGYSYAKVLDEDLKPEAGDKVKRFEQVPAVFLDESQSGSELAQQVKASLPQLKWLTDGDDDKAFLTFRLKDDALGVENAQGDYLHEYFVDEATLVSTTTSTMRPVSTPISGSDKKPLQQLADKFMQVIGSETNEVRFSEMDAAIIRQKQSASHGIWVGPRMEGHPVGLAVADLDGDNQQEVAVVLDKKLIISRLVAGVLEPLAEVKIPSSLTTLGIDAVDSDNDGRAELYFPAVRNFHPASFVVQLTNNGYEIVIDNIGWFIRSVELPGMSTKTLVGQRMGKETEGYFGDVFLVNREGDQLKQGSSVGLPGKLSVFSFLPFNDDNGVSYFAHLTERDTLMALTADGSSIWESLQNFGGSETCFDSRKGDDVDWVTPTCMRPRMVKSAGNEILVVQNEGQRTMQRYRNFGKGRVVSMRWNGLTLVESWRSADQFGYVGDYALADVDNDGKEELVMAVKMQHKGFMDGAESSIVSYELQ